MAILLLALFAGDAFAAGSRVYGESFDIVWQTISGRFFDPDFKGVDWAESRERFRSQVVKAEDDDAFYALINTMLFQLGVSHLGVVPMDDPKQLGEAAIFGEGTIGIDVRLVEGRLFVTAVEDGSTAADAGLAIGYEVLRVNGRTLEAIAAERLEFPTPPFTERNERYMVLGEVYWELLGPVGDEVALDVRDPDGHESQLRLERRSRGAQRVFDEGMPPTYVTIRTERIGDDIGYIKFNSFHPALIETLMHSVDDLGDTKGMIIDLRGNPGGRSVSGSNSPAGSSPNGRSSSAIEGETESTTFTSIRRSGHTSGGWSFSSTAPVHRRARSFPEVCRAWGGRRSSANEPRAATS